MEWIQQRVKASTPSTYARAATAAVQAEARLREVNGRACAKTAGCRYVVFTTKHHDGFALHDSKVSDFDAGHPCCNATW
jgi:alpha-L-fucosidase